MGAADDVEEEITTKKEWNVLRASSNTTALAHKFFQDRVLQQRLDMIEHGGRFVQYEYAYCLRLMSEGLDGMLHFAFQRANAEWWGREIAPLLLSVHDQATQEKFKLAPKTGSPVPLTCVEPWYVAELAAVKQYRLWVCALAREETWSQVMFMMCFPQVMQTLCGKDDTLRARNCYKMRIIANSLVKAELACTAHPIKNRALRELLDDLHFSHQWFARYLIAKGRKEAWNSNSEELIATAKAMSSGSATTADALEKTFAWVADHARCHNKNKKMTAILKWFYLNCSPYVRSGGMPMFKCTLEDYMNSACLFNDLMQHTVGSLKMTGKLCWRLVI